MHPIIGKIERWILPYNIYTRIKRRRLENDYKKSLGENALSSIRLTEYDYKSSITHLLAQGLDRNQVEAGSVSEESLKYVSSHLQKLPPQPINGIHIGNFVGVSLTYLAAYAKSHHPNSLIVGIDPNIAHRGISRPQEYVLKLLNHYQLQRNVILATGYSLEKSIADDGVDYTNPSMPSKTDNLYSTVPSCENQLKLLENISKESFDFAFIDGNHDAPYLSREIDSISPLLKNGGLIFLDDVSVHWLEIVSIFENADASRFEKVGKNERVGILRKK